MTTISGMIFAKVDVCFWRDKKFRRAGLDGCAYWAAVLTWLREDETEDGVIPFDQVGAPLGVGDKLGRKLCDKLASAEVGLFAKRDHGYELLLYREKGNETKADVAARRAGGRERSERWRRNGSGDASRDGDGDVSRATSPERHESSHELVSPSHTRARARSDSASDSASGVSSVSSSGVQGGPSPADDSRPVSLDEPITAGALGRVEAMAMAIAFRPADVAAEWLKYLGKVGSKWPRSQLEGNWQSWLIEAKRIAAKDARRDAASAPPRKAAAVQQEISPKHLRGKEF